MLTPLLKTKRKQALLISSFLAVLAQSTLQSFGAEGSAQYHASGQIVSSILTPQKSFQTKTLGFETTRFADQWRIQIGGKEITEAVWDGTNQYVVKLPKGQATTALPALVHPHEVPQGGGWLRSLWFGFSLFKFSDGELSPNLISFQYPPFKTNTIFRLKRDAAGNPAVADLVFPHQGKEYLTQRLTVIRATNEAAVWLPLEFKVEIFARLGIEFSGGSPSIPNPNTDYSQVLEKYEIVVTNYSSETIAVKDVGVTDLHGHQFKVLDQRIGGVEFPLAYTATNNLPAESEIRANPALGRTVAALELAQQESEMRVQANRHNSARRYFVLIALSGISLFALIIWRQIRRKEPQLN